MILKTAVVRKFRSIEDSGTVRFEPDVTCLVGKNESGKTAFLEAVYQANPFGGPGRGFDELRDYPRRLRGLGRLARAALPSAAQRHRLDLRVGRRALLRLRLRRLAAPGRRLRPRHRRGEGDDGPLRPPGD